AAHVKALEAIVETGRSGAYNLGTGRPHSVREVIDTVQRVSGRTVPWTLGPRRPGDPAVLYAAPHKAQAELHWTPAHPELESIVRTAWERHSRHPGGCDERELQGRQRLMPPERTQRRGRSAYARPYRGRLAWAIVGMVIYAVGSAGLAYLIKPIFDNLLPKQQDVSSTAWAIVAVYLLKGGGSYASSYL